MVEVIKEEKATLKDFEIIPPMNAPNYDEAIMNPIPDQLQHAKTE